MAITSCKKCGTSNWKRTKVDAHGTLAVCVDGHWNYEDHPAGTGGGGSISTGNVTVAGQSAIGNGATATGKGERR
nr:hypothetical protein [Micromonospora sp. DSM 115978]